MSVCATCGVTVTEARTGRLVHLDDIGASFGEHVIVAVAELDFERGMGARYTLKGAAEDMLAHHATLHPAEGCEWAEVLRRALKQS